MLKHPHKTEQTKQSLSSFLILITAFLLAIHSGNEIYDFPFNGLILLILIIISSIFETIVYDFQIPLRNHKILHQYDEKHLRCLKSVLLLLSFDIHYFFFHMNYQ